MNADYKTRVSRSLTDLQKSLDEACRRGLPDNTQFSDTMIVRDVELFNGAATDNLERMLEANRYNSNYSHNMISNRVQTVPNYPKVANQIDPQQVYLSTLRTLVNSSNKPQHQNYPKSTKLSRSFDSLPNIENSPVNSGENKPANLSSLSNHRNQQHNHDVDLIKSQLSQLRVGIDEISQKIQYESFPSHRSTGGMSSRPGYMQNNNHNISINEEESASIIEGLKRRLTTYREREQNLIGQMEQMILTVEQSRNEQAEMMLDRNRLDAELDGLRGRMKSLVQEHDTRIKRYEEELRSNVSGDFHKLSDQLKQTTQQNQELRLEIERLSNKIQALEATLQNTESQLRHSEEASNQIVLDKDTHLARLGIQRDEAEQSSSKWHDMLQAERMQRCNERELYEEEICQLKQRLSSSNDKQLLLNQENINLIKALDELRVEAIREEQKFTCELKEQRNTTQSNIKSLKKHVEKLQRNKSQMKQYYSEMLIKADCLMRNQLDVTSKLKYELDGSIQELDTISDRHRADLGELERQLDSADGEVKSLRNDNQQLRNDLNDYIHQLNNFKQRIAVMQDKRNEQDLEIVELLTNNNRLMKSVELLGAEMLDLRRSMIQCNCGAINEAKKLKNEKMLEQILEMGFQKNPPI